jgi:C-terminal processing protease CtpA/Prc
MWTQPDSPASEAGIQAGDAIESVNGAAPDSIGMPAVRAMFRRPGETYRLLLRRGDQTHEIALTTRRLI